MEVYADPITVNCRKVLAGLQLMGVDYNLNKVDYLQGEQKGPAYVAINPNAALPAMRDDGLTLWESNAILQYAADKHGKTAFYPTDAKTRADINPKDPKPYLMAAVGSFVNAAALAWLIRAADCRTVTETAALGGMLGVGVVTAAAAKHYAFSGWSARLLAIDLGLDAVGFTLMGVIIGAMK